jgi:hypothetical protein
MEAVISLKNQEIRYISKDGIVQMGLELGHQTPKQHRVFQINTVTSPNFISLMLWTMVIPGHNNKLHYTKVQ